MSLLSPTLTWNPPPVLLAGMVVDTALNATATGTNGALTGSFVYTPPAGTIAATVPVVPPYAAVAPTYTLQVTFTPDDPAYAVASASVTIALATSYVIPTEARLLMGGMPAVLLGLLPSQADADLVALLLTASRDIDRAIRYQGRKLIETQEREFPRLADGPAPITRQFAMGYPGFFGLVYPFSADTRIWDLDLTGATTGTVTAIVPPPVKLATIWQAAWLLNPAYAERLEAIRSGLAAQGIGSGSETYLKPADLAVAGAANLGNRADAIMVYYRLRGGRML